MSGFTLGCIWASPLTAAGWLLATLTRSHYVNYYLEVKAGGARVYVGGNVLFQWFFVPRKVVAFTWGGVIIAATLLDAENVIEHELVHFKQARQWGPLLPIAYGAAAIVAMLRGGDAYFDNWFETQARDQSGC